MEPIVKDAIADARALIQGRIAELHEELGHLERALRQLDGAEVSASKPASKRQRAKGKGRPSSKGRGKRKSQRSPRGQRSQQLLEAIKAKPGSTATELAKAIGVQPSQVYGLLSKAKAEKAIVKDGTGFRVPKAVKG